MKYIKRIIDKDLDIRVRAFGAISIVGPKGCGKTRTAKERCNTIIEFEDEEKRDGYISVAENSPSLFLKNKTPILFDEWQDAPKIWGTIRKECDDNDHFGDYFLTGSSTKKINTAHSGTARISEIEMLPMSLYELGKSNGSISVKDLFDNPNMKIEAKSDLSIEELIKVTCTGGWPRTLAIKDDAAKLLFVKDYFNQICKEDICRIDGTKRNPEITKAILKSYARNIGTLCKMDNIYKDVNSTNPMSEPTFYDYIEKLKQLYVIKDYEAWCPQIRSEKSLRAPKKHMFIDPSIAIAALDLSPSYFYNDLDLFGHVFESLVYRDLTVYSAGLRGVFSHYHDKYDLEVDGVLHLQDGRYALIEIKLGSSGIKAGEKNLLKIKELIKERNQKKDALPIREPDLMIIITGGEYAYSLESGVKIIPIGCLKD